jgi:hypothetical protein
MVRPLSPAGTRHWPSHQLADPDPSIPKNRARIEIHPELPPHSLVHIFITELIPLKVCCTDKTAARRNRPAADSPHAGRYATSLGFQGLYLRMYVHTYIQSVHSGPDFSSQVAVVCVTLSGSTASRPDSLLRRYSGTDTSGFD